MFGIFKKLKAKSEAINTYCWDAMKAHIFLEDEAGADALVTSLIVMGDSQRESMVKALDHFTSGVTKAMPSWDASEEELMPIRTRIQKIRALFEFVSGQKWDLLQVAKAKRMLAERHPAEEKALSNFDAGFFKKKHGFHKVLTDA